MGKRAVRRGGVRVYSQIVSEPVEEQVNLREEHVRGERRPVNRAMEAGDMERLRYQTVEVTESAEEPVVSKRARVTEAVVVGKESTERTETIRDTVRRTEVRVDPIAGVDSRSTQGSASYQYGYQMGSDPKFAGRSWTDVQDQLRSDYIRRNPTSKWGDVKDEIRRGWGESHG